MGVRNAAHILDNTERGGTWLTAEGLVDPDETPYKASGQLWRPFGGPARRHHIRSGAESSRLLR